MYVCMLNHSVMSNCLWPHGLVPTKVLCPWNSLGKNNGVGYHFLLQFYTWCCIYVNPKSLSSSHPPFSLLCQRLFSTSVSLFLPCKWVHLYHFFSRFHLYALICSISFSLSDFLLSVWQTLGSSALLQMIQFSSFLWLSNIPPWASQVVQW